MTYRPSTNAGPDGPEAMDAYSLDACTVCGFETDALRPLDGEHVCDSCHERDAMNAEAFPVAPAYALDGMSPAEHRAAAIAEDAAVVLAHILSVGGVRFDARRKVEASEEYSYLGGGSTLAIPTKLSGVAPFQANAEAVAGILATSPNPTGRQFYPAKLYRGTDAEGCPTILVLADTVPGDGASVRVLGMLQDKHTRWLEPLLATNPAGAVTDASCPVRVYVTAVTGGTPEKPTRGVNVVLTGVAEAVRQSVAAEALTDRQRTAYESGDLAAVEAATE